MPSNPLLSLKSLHSRSMCPRNSASDADLKVMKMGLLKIVFIFDVKRNDAGLLIRPPLHLRRQLTGRCFSAEQVNDFVDRRLG